MRDWTVTSIVERLVALDEGERIEAKSGLGDAVLKTVSAFCNTVGLDGGWIVFGLQRTDEGTLSVTGVTDPDKLQTDLQSQLQGRLSHPIATTISSDLVNGAPVVVVFIPEVSPADKPVYVRKQGLVKGAYLRIGSTDTLATAPERLRWASLAQPVLLESRPAVDATTADFDDAAIAAYRRQLRDVRPSSSLLDVSDADLLRAIGAATANGQPTMLGLWLFGAPLSLRRLQPALRIDVLTAYGTSLDDEYDVLEVREGLVTGWRKVFRAVEATLPRRIQLTKDSVTRSDTSRIPSVVVREAVINAVMHRDYSVNAAIQVRCYTDRIEVQNPGYSLLPEGEWGTLLSKARNPMLADALHDLDLAERRGTGIRRMRKTMRDAGLSEPELLSDRAADSFRIVLRHHHFLDDEGVDWLAQFQGLGLQDSEVRVLLHIREHGRVDNKTVCRLTGVGTHAATLILRRLRKAKAVVQHAKGTKTFYTLGNPVDPEQVTLFPNADGDKPGSSRVQDGDKTGTRRGQDGDKMQDPEVRRLLAFCESPRSMSEMLEHLGRASRQQLQAGLVKPLLSEGLLEMTMPDKPTSGKQRYRTTDVGLGLLGGEM